MKTTLDRHWTEQGIELWSQVAELLNDEIRRGGKVSRNNRRIWDTLLHRWTNLEWAAVIAVMRDCMDTNPELFKGYHETAVLTADMTLTRYWDTPTGKSKTWGPQGRILDQPEHKALAWQTLMAMREIWNKIQGVDLPNDNSSQEQNKITIPKLFDHE
jgi:hypothetical protein